MFDDESAWTNKLNNNWTLTRNLNAGLRANLQTQKQIQQDLSSLFKQASEHEMVRSEEFRSELAYQADSFKELSEAIIDTSNSNTESIVTEILRMSDYIGVGLTEVRFAIEKQSCISIEILEVLLESLDNTSRQYYEQGVKWFENAEYDLAKDRFNKSLDANLTNYFAYQHLGFISLNQKDYSQAIRNFDLAHKIAENSHQKAIALSHLALSHHNAGDTTKAASVAKQATETYPNASKFLYEFAGYSALLGLSSESIPVLREAIERDWVYFTVVMTDNNFDLVRSDVNSLLNELRETQQKRARIALDGLNKAIDTARIVGVGGMILDNVQERQCLENDYNIKNVFLYNKIIPRARDLRENIFTTAENHVEKKITGKRNALQGRADANILKINKLHDSINSLKGERDRYKTNFVKWKAGCGSYTLLFLGYMFSIGIIGEALKIPGDKHSINIYVISCFIVPFLIPPGVNAIKFYLKVIAPQNEITNRIRCMEHEVISEKKKLEDEYNVLNTSIEEELSVLERFLEKLKREHGMNMATYSQ